MVPLSPRQRLLALGLLLYCPLISAQTTDDPDANETVEATNTHSIETSGTLTDITEAKTPTGSYRSYTTTMSINALSDSTTTSSNETEIEIATGETSSASITIITGTRDIDTTVIAGNATASSTSAAPEATNTTPCNNYVEFCQRKYGNITEVAAHNSPFVRDGSAAANQELGVKTQLDDGIRLLQAQMQWATNDTVPHFCHTSCDILDAGPITDWLSQVEEWVSEHPFDVVTILLGNGNYSLAEMYAPYIEQTGITKWAYVPPSLPVGIDQWPTLEELILNQNRVIMLMDYETQPQKYPWLIDEFSVMWETPFDPTDISFPCTVERPPNQEVHVSKDRMYMTNHNYNVEITAFGATILVPATTLLNQTNGVEGEGSLGEGAHTCLADWDRPPTFLNVDYYNYGNPGPGSVFQVAAEMNGVTYDRTCCGEKSAAPWSLVETVPMSIVLSLAILVSFITG